MTLRAISRFVVPARIVADTERELRAAGVEGYELFVLWSGTISDDAFFVSTPHVPIQQSYKLADGLCVRVGGDALHNLNVWLYEHGELLAVQVHSHPREAYHSTTDDMFPIVTALGGLSVVTPEFCRRDLLGPGHALYRLDRMGWTPQSRTLIEVA